MARDTLVVISQLPPPVHGSSVITRELVETLDRAGYRVAFVDRRFSRTVQEIGAPSARKAVAAAGLVLRLARALLRRRVSAAVFFVTNRPGSFVVDVALGLVLRLSRVPTVHYVHTNGFRDLAARGRPWAAAVRSLLASADRVVCLGSTLAEDVAPWVAADRVVVIPNPSASVAPPAVLRTERQTVVFFSNLLPEKGAHVAVEVGVRLAAVRDDVDVEVAGAGSSDTYRAALERRIDETGVGDRVRLLEAVGPARRDELFAHASLLLFPSTYRYEAQPLTIVEAMAAGLPVVAFRVGGIADLVRNGETGVLVDAGDEEALLAAVTSLLDDPGRRAAMARAARAAHDERHSRAAYAAAWRAVLEAVIRS